MSKYLRRKAAAEYANISLRTLSIWMARRIIPFRKIGRTVLFDPAELDAALDKFRIAAVGAPPLRKRRATRTQSNVSDSVSVSGALSRSRPTEVESMATDVGVAEST
ncbi:MAG: helix-turn-helix domain-containing protein [Verrucomicrobiia bacterium]